LETDCGRGEGPVWETATVAPEVPGTLKGGRHLPKRRLGLPLHGQGRYCEVFSRDARQTKKGGGTGARLQPYRQQAKQGKQGKEGHAPAIGKKASSCPLERTMPAQKKELRQELREGSGRSGVVRNAWLTRQRTRRNPYKKEARREPTSACELVTLTGQAYKKK